MGVLNIKLKIHSQRALLIPSYQQT